MIGLRSAWAAYACRIDGEIRDVCCCPKKEKDRDGTPADDPPRIAASCCCDITIGESTDGPQAHKTERVDGNDSPLALVAPASGVSLRVPVAARVFWHAYARPPPRSVPTYLANSSILR